MNNNYLSITDKAKILRKELKEKYNINSKQVSIRSRLCGYSDAIDIEIKDLSIPLTIEKITQIANKFESIRYDKYSGEILSGANTYINVRYNATAYNEIAKNFYTLSEKIIDSFNPDINCGALIASNNDWELFYYKKLSQSVRSQLYLSKKNDEPKFIDVFCNQSRKSFDFYQKEDLASILVKIIYIYKLFSLDDFFKKE